jgi:hypothetical protein
LESFNYLFHAQSESYYYAARIGQSADGSFNDKLTLYNVTNGSTSLIGSTAFTAAMDTSYSIKVGRSGTTVRAKVWETGDTEPGWMVSAADSDWTWGASGFRANFTAEVGTLSQNGYKTYYSPVRID